jgi:hypothetical protein
MVLDRQQKEVIVLLDVEDQVVAASKNGTDSFSTNKANLLPSPSPSGKTLSPQNPSLYATSQG